ncbi:MAG: DUF368 domain-containing protein [Candidatus Egerieousia sp.]
MNRLKEYIMMTLKGAGIGAANVIPGVSGGTIAFLTGIYERLINSIKSFNLSSFKQLFKGDFKGFAKATDLAFLGCIFLGLLISAFSLSKLMVYLLHNHPIITWSFFFGLVLVSCWYVVKDIKVWNIGTYISLAAGIAVAVYVCLASPSETPDTWWFLMICGAIAICAMILPGISGSFILVLLVKYEYVMNCISSLNIPALLLFALGAVIGIVAFSHLLSWLLKKAYYQTMALLTGFMVGSLLKIWPWQRILAGVGDKAISRPTTPEIYSGLTGLSPQIGSAILFAIIGIAIVVILETLAAKGKSKESCDTSK